MNPTHEKTSEKKQPEKNRHWMTKWDLGLMYSSIDDQKMDEDMKKTEEISAEFVKKYKDKTDYITDANALFKALGDYERLMELAHASRPIIFLQLTQSLHGDDPKIQAKINLFLERYTALSNSILFFELNLGKIAPALQRSILEDAFFSHYAYFLKEIFDKAKHALTEAEERILNVKAQPAYSLWVDGVERVVSALAVKHGGKKIPLPEASNKIPDLPLKERRKLHKDMLKELKSVSDFAESEINAIVINKKSSDELRHFAQPYSSTILSYQNDEKSVMALVEAVTKHFDISHRFYKLKAKMLKLPKLEYSDRAAQVGGLEKKVSFEQSVEILEKVYEGLGPAYGKILNDFLQKGQIDVYPHAGKRGGAFCANEYGVPTYVLLNHVDGLKSLATFAHEMGHAIHAEFSKTQPAIYQGCSTAVAETASTLFEQFVFDHVFNELSEKEKIIALHDRIQDAIQTVFRQIAAFNFEAELHQRIRAEGYLPKAEIAKLMSKHMKSYLGPMVKVSEDDGYVFVNWSHIRYFFYVYSYAYGALISKALYSNYKKDKKYLKKIEQFLHAGESKSPEQIFKDCGINVTKPEFFVAGLKDIEADIAQLEKLCDNL